MTDEKGSPSDKPFAAPEFSTVRPHSNETKEVIVGLFANKEQVRFQVTVAEPNPIACERVVAVCDWERLILNEKIHSAGQESGIL